MDDASATSQMARRFALGHAHTGQCRLHALLNRPPVCAGLHGAKVMITGRREGVLSESVADLQRSGCTAAHSPGDVRKAEDSQRWVRDTVALWGGLDILVNCAAGAVPPGASFATFTAA